jgi:hypothetical protein|tara:strand:- start:2047 stop:2199 length:153 start_codon:yes stop_codon:yes gene_type:complete
MFIYSLLLRLMGHPRLIGVLFAEYAMHAVGMYAFLGLRSFCGQRNLACPL